MNASLDFNSNGAAQGAGNREIAISELARSSAEEYLESLRMDNGQLPEIIEVPQTATYTYRDAALAMNKITPDEAVRFCEIFNNHCAGASNNKIL